MDQPVIRCQLTKPQNKKDRYFTRFHPFAYLAITTYVTAKSQNIRLSPEDNIIKSE